MLRARKILKPDVPPPRIAEKAVRIKRGAFIAGIGLCGITGFIVALFFVV